MIPTIHIIVSEPVHGEGAQHVAQHILKIRMGGRGGGSERVLARGKGSEVPHGVHGCNSILP